MKKIAILFAIVGLVVGVAYAVSLEDLRKRRVEKEASKSEEETNESLKEIFKKGLDNNLLELDNEAITNVFLI